MDTTVRKNAEQLIAEVESAFPAAQPVPQPGRPPMSQGATDRCVLMLTASVASIPIGGMTSLVLYTLGGVDPVTIGLAAGGITTVIVAVAGLIRSAARSVAAAAPPGDTVNHYHGSVTQENRAVATETRGLFAKTINKP